MNREELQENYVQEILEGCDMETLMEIARGGLEKELDSYTLKQLKAEVRDFYPHLLDEDNYTVEDFRRDYMKED